MQVTKELWDEIREKENIPFELFHAYFNDVKPSHYKNLSFVEFGAMFSTWVRNIRDHTIILMTPERLFIKRYVTYEGMLNKIFDYYDKKFENE